MIDHLSYSSITTYVTCPKSWKFRYVDNAPAPTSPALVFGSAFHEAVEQAVINKVDPLKFWSEAWAKATTGKEVVWGLDTPESHSNEGVRILTHPDIMACINGISPLLDDGKPVIEKKVELHVPGVTVPIIGYIDLITSDGIPCDLKTSAKSWGEKAQGETQPLFYLAALNQLGRIVPENKFRHYVFVKTKTPKVEVHECRHKYDAMFWLFGMIRSVWSGIEHEVFPENPTSWKCNSLYCDYYRICRGRYE